MNMEGRDTGTASTLLSELQNDPKASEVIALARANLAAVRAGQAPGGEQAVRSAIAYMAIDRPPQGKSAAHLEKHFAIFVKNVAGEPRDAILEGANDVLMDPDILGFPRVADFAKKVRAHSMRIRAAAYRLKVLAGAKIEPAPPPPTEEEKAKVAAMMGELKRDLRDGAKERPPKRYEDKFAVAAELRAMDGVQNGH